MNATLRLAMTLDNLKTSREGTMIDAWARYLEVPFPSSDFLRALTQVFVTHAKATSDIERSSISERAKNLYFKAAQDLAQFCNPIYLGGIPATNLADHHGAIDMLFLAAETLPEDEIQLNPITLDAVILQVSDLINDLEEIDIDPLFKEKLIAQLRTFLMALRSYEILGIEGLSSIYGATASEIGRLASEPQARSEKTKAWVGKARVVLKTIGAGVIWAAAVVGGANDLLTDGSELLGLTDASDTLPKKDK